ncbi:hypothetical protein FG877_10865 [Enterococcus casseliflavus]|nr:hypothetical protein [Enterococcus casseliflavus]
MSYKAGIVMRTKFISPGDKRFNGAIRYLDKEQSKRINNLDKYYGIEFMSEAEKTPKRISALFNGYQDYLDAAHLVDLKGKFELAKERESPTWQTVFSFDHEYLKEIGLYSQGEHGFIDESAIRQATIGAMNKLVEDMGFGSSAAWGAAIHFDTDNIHVHTMLVTTDPEGTLDRMTYRNQSMYRAKIPPKATRAMKSKFGSVIMDRDASLSRISYLMRHELVKTSMYIGYSNNLKIIQGVTRLMNQLPDDRRLWKYGNNAMIDFRPQLDALSREIMSQNNPSARQELDSLLDEQSTLFQKTFGEATVQEGRPSYKQQQLANLYKNMGNALLTEMKKSMSRDEWMAKSAFTPEEVKAYLEQKRVPVLGKKALNDFKKAIDDSHQEFLSKCAYEREEWRKATMRKRELEHGRGY